MVTVESDHENGHWKSPKLQQHCEGGILALASLTLQPFFFLVKIGRERTTLNPKARKSVPVFWPLFPLYAGPFFL